MPARAIRSAPSLAGVTGLEPATSGVTGRRSNQLSYTPELRKSQEKNQDFAAPFTAPAKAVSSKLASDARAIRALPAQRLVGDDGFEPPTFSV